MLKVFYIFTLLNKKFTTMNKLQHFGIILSNDEQGNECIQHIDNALEWADYHDLEHVEQLSSDEEAVSIVRELIIDNYIETIQQDLISGDRSLLYALLSGNGIRPISDLSEKELIIEAKELQLL